MVFQTPEGASSAITLGSFPIDDYRGVPILVPSVVPSSNLGSTGGGPGQNRVARFKGNQREGWVRTGSTDSKPSDPYVAITNRVIPHRPKRKSFWNLPLCSKRKGMSYKPTQHNGFWKVSKASVTISWIACRRTGQMIPFESSAPS